MMWASFFVVTVLILLILVLGCDQEYWCDKKEDKKDAPKKEG